MSFGQVNADVIGTSVAGSNIGAGNASIMKNRIINGAMVIDQRNAGASTTPASNGLYTLDRWGISVSLGSKFSIQQNAGSVTPPVGFNNYLGLTSTSAYSVGVGENFAVTQAVEGYNFADLGWGTSNAKTVTLSFQVQSSLTGTFGGAILNSAQNRSYVFSYTISSANTWTYVTTTIAGDTTGTWVGATNGTGAYLFLTVGAGSNVSKTAGSWGAGYYVAPTGATSVVGTNGATFYITGVQLEVGSSATGFEYRQYQQELALCQRYYQIVQTGAVARYSDSLLVGGFSYLVPARTIPTVVYSKIIGDGSGSVNQNRSPTAYMASCFQSGGTTSGDCFYQALISAEL
jgi:hypothetical protein